MAWGRLCGHLWISIQSRAGTCWAERWVGGRIFTFDVNSSRTFFPTSRLNLQSTLDFSSRPPVLSTHDRVIMCGNGFGSRFIIYSLQFLFRGNAVYFFVCSFFTFCSDHWRVARCSQPAAGRIRSSPLSASSPKVCRSLLDPRLARRLFAS